MSLTVQTLLLLALTFRISGLRCPAPKLKVTGVRQEAIASGWWRRIGSKVKVTCDNDQLISPINRRHTQIVCQKNATWSQPNLTCVPVLLCPEPTLTVVDVKKERLASGLWRRVGSKVKVSCGNSNIISPIGKRHTYITCLNNATWSGPNLLCIPGCPPPVFNARYQLRSSSSQQQRVFNLGETVAYTCGVGYARLAGSAIRKCTETGWSFLTLKCQRRTCGSAGEILNGRYVYNGGVMFGDNVTALCNKGYFLIGDDTRYCLHNGWDGRDALCLPVQCGPPPRVPGAVLEGSVEEPHVYGHVVIYSCPGGTLLGEAHIHCTLNGTWSSPPPQCSDVTCSQPVIPYGYRTRNYKLRYKPGEEVGVACDYGTTMIGHSRIICGAGGQWAPLLPRCVWSR